MAKLTLSDISGGYISSTTFNANNTLLEAALENTLSRDGTGPNQMGADLDLNSNRITNLTDGVNNQDAVTVYQLTQGQLGVLPLAANVTYEDTNNYFTSTTVETVINEFYEEVTTGYLPLAGGTMTGATVTPEFTDYSLTSTSPTSTSNAVTFDIENGNSFQHTLTENTTVTLSNPADSGKFCEIIVKFIQDSTGSWTVTWPASVKWPGGTAPVITTTLSTGVDIISLKTWDGGTTWYGDFSQDYS